jgi:hypothetical protein
VLVILEEAAARTEDEVKTVSKFARGVRTAFGFAAQGRGRVGIVPWSFSVGLGDLPSQLTEISRWLTTNLPKPTSRVPGETQHSTLNSPLYVG